MKIHRLVVGFVVVIGTMFRGIGPVLLNPQPIALQAVEPTIDSRIAVGAAHQGAVATQDQQADTAGENDDGSNDDGDSDNAIPSTNTPITSAQAKAITEAANPGTRALDAEFEHEGGADLFEIALDNGLQVMVDSTTGTIINSGIDD